MPTRSETVQALKNLANLVMSVLTMLLQVSMQMIEGELQPESADLTQHLEQMYGQLDQQRMFLQNLIVQQQSQIHAQTSQSGQASPHAVVKHPGSSKPRGSPSQPAVLTSLPLTRIGSPGNMLPEPEDDGSSAV